VADQRVENRTEDLKEVDRVCGGGGNGYGLRAFALEEECDLPATSARHSLPATSAYQTYRGSLASNRPALAPARALLFTSPREPHKEIHTCFDR